MALQLKRLDIDMKGALDDFIADWKDEEIIPSTLQKYTGDIDEFLAQLDTLENDPPRLMACCCFCC